VGETLGMAGPALVAGNAPRIAAGMNQMVDNAMAPRTMSRQAGAVYGGKVADNLNAKYGDKVDAYLIESGDKIELSKVVVPKGERGQGVGTQFMDDLVAAADAQGKTVTLTPSSDFGGNKARLEQFYRRFGFVPNKGRNKDFAISEAMYRPPMDGLMGVR
jgi:GNAT superfamily N-acetyltransferase